MAELVSIKRNVDVSPGQAAPAVFHCSQGDVGSKIILGLLNNGTAYSIPSGVTVTIEGSESNGSIFTPISATASGSDITFYLTGEMTAVAGPAICQAVLKSGSNILGTANFTLEVESSPMGADAPPVFTDAGWTWMLNKLNTEFVPALGNETIIDAIDSKADQSDLTALSNTVAGHTGSITVLNNTVNNLNQSVTENRQNISRKLDKNQGTTNAGKYLKVGADGNVETVATDTTLSVSGGVADAKAVGDELSNLKADLMQSADDLKSAINKTSQVVYKTDISSTAGLIPFHAKNGDSITIKTKDGTNFIDSDQLRFYDANGAMIQYWATIPLTVNFRTFTYNEETEALYIGITKVAPSVVDYIVENANNTYNNEQRLSNVENDVSLVKEKVESIENNLYEQTVILTDNSLHQFPIANGTTIVITTTDGTSLPEGNPYLQCFDSNGTFSEQFLCSSAYGASRTVTISEGDVASVRMYSIPAKPIKVYVPDNSKLIPKVEEIANLVGQNTIIVDASGAGDYTSFTQAIYDTVDSGIDVLVKPGTYDIVAEYVALFGQSAVDSMADSDSAIFNGFQYGVRLRKRKVEFAPGAHLVCDWTGHTVDGTHRFSALGVDYNVEIIGLDLDATATFYCIHDDYGIATPYTVKYENCRVVGHNITNADCIGGGCKKYSRHILNNCYFDNNLTGSATVRYHNTNAEGAEPEIYVSNCYFNNWFTPRWYGPQTSKMRVYVNNCHARAIYKMAESSSYDIDNVELYKWNNEETDPRT